MRKSCVAWVATAVLAGVPGPASASADEAPDLSGRWAINRALSQFPRDVGFGLDWLVPASGQTAGGSRSGGGSRGGRGGGQEDGSNAAAEALARISHRESEEDAHRVRLLTDEVRTPAGRLSIVNTAVAVIFTDDRGQSRTFHPTGKEEIIQIEGVPVGVTAKREGGRLVAVYRVEPGRELRYTYSRTVNPPQLVVETQFIERGGGDLVTRVYEPARATETPSTVAGVEGVPPALARPRESSGERPGSTGSGSGQPSSSLGNHAPEPGYNQQPDGELRGLTKLGLVVEGLSGQAIACGLNQSTIETAVGKKLSDAGFKVLRNTDEDTYLYINIVTISQSAGVCISRYDAFLYSHTTARMSYLDTPVLVQVSLLHKGGIAGGSAAAHTEAVLRGLQDYVDQFATRIRAANR